ncbi:MAG: ABC-F type ribosomal protection protein [Butyrivibrio sp.]|uniref:ribosomal protection-like ABC-F family protein n=1 Tax=Butyrivibrio sp. TaxID=28121 RepID=UPI0025BF2FF1|nr:ABC-F type ribosomal protection protein [Butyrivibrio sp.]MBQ6587799.1 ABC-F type ribosomal protection protein [Butyrivibrio sp.]
MSQIRVSDLTFAYDNSADDVLTNVSFNIDTDWKLGFIGRNGKGKTTLLNLLMGKYEYKGSISASTKFDYFPYPYDDTNQQVTADEMIGEWKPQVESWQVMVQMNQLSMDAECLYRPFISLSHGEKTRIMLAVLFATENEFLLIDEPTNHLDQEARRIVKEYLSKKKGFILVSHDRDLLDAVCDHVLVLNRQTVEVQAGNFSSWWDNKEKSDSFAKAENEKHLKEIGKLKAAADRNSRWADKSENSKIGFDPVKEHDRSISSRSFIGAKTKKMEARVKAFENRIDREIEEKEGLLQDIETVVDLKLCPLKYHKNVLIDAKDLTLRYEDAAQPLFENLRFQVKQGDRVIISGENGCGKSSIIKAIFQKLGENKEPLIVDGTLNVGSGLIVSYVNQDTSFLVGSLKDFCEKRGFDYSLFLAILRQLDFGRAQFYKNMEDYSEGQKKKVLIAASLITPAHLYIWDEPLNYIDVFSRMQIEKLILEFEPTMLIVEHDVRFQEKIATDIVKIQEG